jgi:hypothetical protein
MGWLRSCCFGYRQCATRWFSGHLAFLPCRTLCFAFVRPSFCLVFDLIVLDSVLPPSGCPFAVSLLYVPPTHPTENLHVNPHRKPRVNPHDNLKRRERRGSGGGTYGTRTCLGGEEDREWGECPDDAGFAKEVCGIPEAGRKWKLERMEGHRCIDTLGPEDLGIVPKLRKKWETFFRID